MFERFTDRARKALFAGQVEARELGHDFLGTEHILLGLLADPDGVAGRVLSAHGFTAEGVRASVVELVGRAEGGPVGDAEALATIGIDLDEVRAAVEEAFGEGALDRVRSKPWFRRLGAPAFAPRAKKVIELSLREALSLGHNYIGTEHLLLAILREGHGVAAKVLAARIDLDDLRAAVIDELRRLRPGA